MGFKLPETSIEKVEVSAFTIPTDAPEGDGTFEWDSTTIIVCEIHAAGLVGLGYTYGNQATAFVADHLANKCLLHRAALDPPALHAAMLKQVRNDGSRGIASMAISAVDVALWDLKAKLLDISVTELLGALEPAVWAYGSGGFTTYNSKQLTSQLSALVAEGLKSVKMKIGADPAADFKRVGIARRAIGDETSLFVDANGAFSEDQTTFVAGSKVWRSLHIYSRNLTPVREKYELTIERRGIVPRSGYA